MKLVLSILGDVVEYVWCKIGDAVLIITILEKVNVSGKGVWADLQFIY
jgi:hypothetical protein